MVQLHVPSLNKLPPAPVNIQESFTTDIASNMCLWLLWYSLWESSQQKEQIRVYGEIRYECQPFEEYIEEILEVIPRGCLGIFHDEKNRLLGLFLFDSVHHTKHVSTWLIREGIDKTALSPRLSPLAKKQEIILLVS